VNASSWSQRQVPCNNTSSFTHDEQLAILIRHCFVAPHQETTMTNTTICSPYPGEGVLK
jgi:hypothetical protein